MRTVTITCPTCAYSGVVREEAVPAGRRKLECPQCHGTFTFTKETAVGATASSSPTPAGSRRAGVPPPRPSGARPGSGPLPKAPPPGRGRRELLAAACAMACAAVVLGVAWMYAFRVPSIAAEKLLIVALFSRVPTVQRVAIRALRDYPTKHAAIALVAFINLKNLQEVPDPKKPETAEDKARRREQRVRDLKLAERAAETLCLLTGQSFGTYFKLEPYGHSWGSLSEGKWPTVLFQIDSWALQTLGAGDLPPLPGLPGAAPQPAGAPGGEVAR
jgi:hypothetical protein